MVSDITKLGLDVKMAGSDSWMYHYRQLYC